MHWGMRWNRRYLLGSYVRGSLWIVPFVAVLLSWVSNRLTSAAEGWLLRTGRIDEATAFYGASMAGARTLLETVCTGTLSFLVFTFGSLLVAIQVAGGQYTPRVIATTLLRDDKIRSVVGLLVFTWLFAVRVLSKLGDETVHQLDLFVAGMLGLISVVGFLYLIDYAARSLRPISIVASVGRSGLDVIRSVYPSPPASAPPAVAFPGLPSPARTVAHSDDSGVVLAVNTAGLVEGARRTGGMIELVPQVGDFVAKDEPLFRLFGGAVDLDDSWLRASVALGVERTMDQDPTFAFRILVDIAIKALSPAINDPTTAVVAIDQLHRLLRRVGLRDLRNDEVRDDSGEVRLVLRTPDWEDYVHLACTEIRHCGGSSVQIVRRMRSMLQNLVETLPSQRHAELQLQLELLSRTVEGYYKFPEDLELASIPDPQGLGGSIGVRPAQASPITGSPALRSGQADCVSASS